MLVKIPILSCLAFGLIYPIFFALSAQEPIKSFFHRFHIACPLIVAGLSFVGLFMMPDVDILIKGSLLCWLCCGFIVAGISWHQEQAKPAPFIVLAVAGIILYICVHMDLLGGGYIGAVAGLISGFAVAIAFYAMNLGHFYLNVHGLNVRHLINATIAFAGILGLRLVWDILCLVSTVVSYNGEPSTALAFSFTFEGFFIWIAFLFGAVLPLSAMYFAFGTLRLKNTQATTGILYVILAAVLLGDLASKYYWVKYQLYL